jgi:ketosteroid isomerase-like protein
MTDAERAARELLGALQQAVSAKDLEALTALLTEDVVLFGTAAANLHHAQTVRYLEQVVAQDGVIRWEWDTVLPLSSSDDLLVFTALGSVGFDDDAGRQLGDRDPFRLTCVAVHQGGRWLLRHFHGSVPQPG